MTTAFNQSLLETPIAVLGAGAWGTALAILLAKNGQPVRLWTHERAHIQQMQQQRMNMQFLPNIPFPSNIMLFDDLAAALYDTQDVLIVVPSHAFAEVLKQAKPHLLRDARIVWGTKGLTASGELLHTAAQETLEKPHPLAVLSGPSFAAEVVRGLPTAVTLASTNPQFTQAIITRFTNAHFRMYTTHDITGVEICGVVKNVLAIAAGIVDGLALGTNALSALITRGLVEMKRLGMALGGQADTFTGLAGLGDLVLTCTDNQSRNRRFGRAIAKGKTAADALQEIGQAVEGYYNAKSVHDLAQKLTVTMPIAEQVYQVLYQNKTPQAAIQDLLSREAKSEAE